MKGPQVHYCEECDDPNAGWGFDVLFRNERGDVQSVRLWFCYPHRDKGRELWARSREEFQPKARPRPAPETVAQGTLDL